MSKNNSQKTVEKTDPNLQPSKMNGLEDPWSNDLLDRQNLLNELYGDGRLKTLVSKRLRQSLIEKLKPLMGHDMAVMSYQGILQLVINAALIKIDPSNYGRLMNDRQFEKISNTYKEEFNFLKNVIKEIMNGKSAEQIQSSYDLR